MASHISKPPKVKQPGTYWYHSHEQAQYPDGLRGPLIISDPDSPYKGQYDEEIVLTLSDWYHDQMPALLSSFISFANPTGAEPVPKSALMNDAQNLTIAVEPGKTYMFRIANVAAFAAQYLWFENHTMQIVEVDGIYTEKADADMIYITPAQRYSVLITAKNDSSTNFAIVGSMDEVELESRLLAPMLINRRTSSIRFLTGSIPMSRVSSSTTPAKHSPSLRS